MVCGYAVLRICKYADMWLRDIEIGHVALSCAAIRHLISSELLF